jgi:O-antigen/teichoic acid export membrane protein
MTSSSNSPGGIFSGLTKGWGGLVRWQNVILQMLHFGLGGILIMALWVLLGRAWGVEQFGRFNYVYTFAAFFGIVVDFGLDILLTRSVASGSAGIDRSLFAIKGVVFVFFGFVFAGIALIMDIDKSFHVLLLLMAGVVFLSATTFLNGVLRGLERLHIEAVIGLAQKVLFVSAAGGGALIYGFGPAWAALLYLASHVLAFIITFWYVPAEKRNFSDKSYPIYQYIIEVLPLWAVSVLTFLSLRLDVFLLKWLASDSALGIYTAGFRFIEGFFLFGAAFMAACFPRLVASRNNILLYRSVFRKSFLFMAAAGLSVFVTCLFVAGPVFEVSYGAEFASSGKILVFLSGAMPLIFLSLLMGQALVAMQRQGSYLAALIIGLFVNSFFGFILIPVFESFGAVYAFWAREIVISLILGIYTWKTIKKV